MDQCATTLKAKIKIDDALIESLLAKFDAYGVKRKALEANIERRLESITPALVIRLGDIYNSLEDGMSCAARLQSTRLPAACPPTASSEERIVLISRRWPEQISLFP